MGSATAASGFASGFPLEGVDGEAVGLTDFFLSARSVLFGFRSFLRELRGGVRSLSLPLELLLRDELRPRRLRSLRLCRDLRGGVRSPLSERTRPPPLLILALRGGVLSPLFERFRALCAASRGGVATSSLSFRPASSLGFDLRGEAEALRASRTRVRSPLGERDFSQVFLVGSSSFTTDFSFSASSSRSLVLLTSALLCFCSASFGSGCSFFAAWPLVTLSLSAFASALGERSLLRVGSSFIAAAATATVAVVPFRVVDGRVARGGVTERDVLLSCVIPFFTPLSSLLRAVRSDVVARLPRAGDLSEDDEPEEDLDRDERELPLALRRRLSPRRPAAAEALPPPPPRDLERERDDEDDEAERPRLLVAAARPRPPVGERALRAPPRPVLRLRLRPRPRTGSRSVLRLRLLRPRRAGGRDDKRAILICFSRLFSGRRFMGREESKGHLNCCAKVP